MADAAGSTSIGYEPGNALGTMWEVAPRLAQKLVRLPNYSKFVAAYLKAVHFHCEKTGRRPERLQVDTYIQDGKVVQRLS